jgi:hypothetical protein
LKALQETNIVLKKLFVYISLSSALRREAESKILCQILPEENIFSKDKLGRFLKCLE